MSAVATNRFRRVHETPPGESCSGVHFFGAVQPTSLGLLALGGPWCLGFPVPRELPSLVPPLRGARERGPDDSRGPLRRLPQPLDPPWRAIRAPSCARRCDGTPWLGNTRQWRGTPVKKH